MNKEHECGEECDHVLDLDMVNAFAAKIHEAADEHLPDDVSVVITLRGGTTRACIRYITDHETRALTPAEDIAVMKDAIETISANIGDVEQGVG